jgi:hypothetical protein
LTFLVFDIINRKHLKISALCTFPNIFFSFQARHLKIYQKVDATLRSLACKHHICNSLRCSGIDNLVLSRTPFFSYFTTCAAPGRRVRKRAMPRSIKRRQCCPMWSVWREPKILEFVILLALYLRAAP